MQNKKNRDNFCFTCLRALCKHFVFMKTEVDKMNDGRHDPRSSFLVTMERKMTSTKLGLPVKQDKRDRIRRLNILYYIL